VLTPALRQVGGTSAGYVLVGASGFALLACGPRLLGSGQYSVLAVAWTITTIFGAGLAQPGEQTITRVIAAGGDRHVVRVVTLRLAALAALSLVLPVLGGFGLDPLLRDSTLWASAVVGAFVGWALLVGPRGQLAGAHAFGAYAAVMAVEALARIALCAAALLKRDAAAGLLAAALCVPLVLSAGVARVLAARLQMPAGDPAGQSHRREQGAITAVSALIQVVLSSAPLWLQVKSADPAVAGAFVTLTTYLRVPLLAVGGVFVVTLSRVSAAVAADDRPRARRVAVVATGSTAGASGVLMLALLVGSGPGLHLLYGRELRVDLGVALLLAASTLLAIVGSVLTQVLYGTERSHAAVLAWGLGAAVATVQLAVAGGHVLPAAAAVATGQAVATAALGIQTWRALRV
jgi:O-antigen/teichoic acid export membrane protein